MRKRSDSRARGRGHLSCRAKLGSGLGLLNLLLDRHLATELAQALQARLAPVVRLDRLQLEAALDLLQQHVVHVVLLALEHERAVDVLDRVGSQDRLRPVVALHVAQLLAPFDLLHHVLPVGPVARPRFQLFDHFLLRVGHRLLLRHILRQSWTVWRKTELKTDLNEFDRRTYSGGGGGPGGGGGGGGDAEKT